MDAVTITCEVCGQSAYVLKASYKYQAEGLEGMPPKEHVLQSIERIIDCPLCGTRTQIQGDGDR